jgi:spermidine dehydrogenase
MSISRRDFLNGMALSLGAGSYLSPLELLAKTTANYPPALTGLRGNHAGSFEAAHAVSYGGANFTAPLDQTDDNYDLIIAGGGISGLSAALLYQQRSGADKKILVLDNHDDFGGHAKQNEFTVDGKRLLCHGGSQSIDSPGSYSPASARVLKDIGINTDPFYEYYDQEFFSSRNLGSGIYFGREKYGKDVLCSNVFSTFSRVENLSNLEADVATYPISDDAKAAIVRMMTSETDYLSGKSHDEKIDLLRKISYTDFIAQYTDIPKDVTDIFRDWPRGIWGVGWDACSALEGFRWGNPGMGHLGLTDVDMGWMGDRGEPYIFHFPDGNAGVARSLVRKLIPEAVPGKTMEDLVLSRVDYSLLDLPGSNVRIRLNSTAVDLRNTADGSAVDVTYVSKGKSHRVRARHAVYAGYHSLLPYICTEVPSDQIEAINYATKVPLVYISIAIRNWRAWDKLGIRSVRCAQPTLMHSFGMDFPVSMGGYNYTSNPDQPTVLHGTWCPGVPDQGLSNIEQHKIGRGDILKASFGEIEEKIVGQMNGALSGGGFDAAKDIAGITVNRWPHGYAYEYNELFDDPSFGPEKGPHLVARKQIGRISIANSDSSAYAYVDGAIDAADRAVNEQLKL